MRRIRAGEQFYRDMSLYASGELEKRVEALVQRRLGGRAGGLYCGGVGVLRPAPERVQRGADPPDRHRGAGGAGDPQGPCGRGGARVLDLCAGSGCVGLAIAANAPGCRVVLGELAEGALRVCKQNVRRNELNARVTCLSVDAMEPPSSALWDFDVIVSNPPTSPPETFRVWIPPCGTMSRSSPWTAERMAWTSTASSRPDGKTPCGWGPSSLRWVSDRPPRWEEILAQNGFEQIQTTADTLGIWRVVEGSSTDKQKNQSACRSGRRPDGIMSGLWD